jgi:hypothetical protein
MNQTIQPTYMYRVSAAIFMPNGDPIWVGPIAFKLTYLHKIKAQLWTADQVLHYATTGLYLEAIADAIKKYGGTDDTVNQYLTSAKVELVPNEA